MRRPDWRRLGASFGVPDLCVAFPFPVTVHWDRDGRREPLAERAIGLREGPEGVSVEVACGLVLTARGARLASLAVDLDGATVRLPVARSHSA